MSRYRKLGGDQGETPFDEEIEDFQRRQQLVLNNKRV